MAQRKKTLLTDLSTRDLKRLLAARERIDVLEAERKRLAAELARVDKELDALLTGKAAGAKKTVRRKARGRKKVTAMKKAGRKKVVKKKVARKTTKKTGTRKSAASPRVKLEDVVLAVLRKKGKPLAFKDLYEAIVGGKLFRSKSKNFDNVLRRTLSTSKLVKRVGRGVYDAA